MKWDHLTMDPSTQLNSVIWIARGISRNIPERTAKLSKYGSHATLFLAIIDIHRTWRVQDEDDPNSLYSFSLVVFITLRMAVMMRLQRIW